MLMANGSLFMATANEDAIGTYTCTPYNSYGTMGPSQPTQVVLQDPPFFSVLPHEEYQQEVGTKLVIPCHARGDPSPSITWTKVGPAPRSPYTVAANGSLVLQLLSKDHHGAWECLAANRVATVTGHTRVTVLGTTPHAVSSVSVDPGTDQVNVSWVPGFDGGHAQKFTVWMKQTSGQKQNVLPVNKVGTGPFGEIATVQTLVPLPDLPPAVTMVPELAPPLSLWANQSLIGIVLKWVPPPPQGPPITGFILQSRQEGEEDWNVLNGDIGANDSEILLQGLQKDCSYELRMLSLRDGLVSTPSQPLNISTAGMGAFPARPRLLEGGPKPHVAGVLAGVGVLSVVVLLLLGTACFLNRSKRHRRRRKKREDIPDALQKCPPGKTGILADSPDSVLKMKACLLNTIFPKFAASRSDISSLDDSSCIECQDQDRQLLSQPRPKSCLWEGGECEGSGVPPNATLESISRGPDGRFIVQPCEDSSASSCIEDFPECHGGGSMLGDGRMSRWAYRRSSLLCSEREEKADLAVVLSVDLPDFSQGSCSDSDSYTDPCGSTRRCTPVAGDPAGWGGREGRAGSLPRDRAWELVDGRTLVTQMEQERETGHLSRCLTLAREREALERELEHCEARLSLRAWRRETCGAQGPEEADEVPKRECSHQQDPQLRGKDWPRPDPRRGSHLGVDMAGLKVSASPCTPGDSSPIASVSRCVPAPCLERKAWPQDVSWEESGAGPFAPSSLPTNPESTCLLSDDVKAGSCLWRAPPKGSGGTSVSVPTREAGSDKNSTDSSQRCLLQERNEEGGKDNGGHSLGSTWPYRRGGGEHKTKAAESLGTTPGGSSTPLLPESEKEVVRAHLWQSDKSPFTDSPCSKSPLTNLIANSDRSSQPDFSVSQISGSVRPSPMPQHYETSQLHASPILKFLSLPGFVEMNVDEPVDNNNTAPVSSWLKSGQRPGNIFPSELKVVPLAWAAHTQKDREAGLRQRCAALAEELPAAGRDLRSSTEPLRMETCHFPAESGAVSSRGRMGPSEKCRPSSDGTLRRPLKRSQSLTCETPAGRGDPLTPVTDRTRRSDSHGGRASWGLSLDRDSDRALTQTTQGPGTQGSRTHPLPSVCDPVPHGRGRATTTDMNKTLRRGPNRTQREVPPDLAVRKSASLRLQTREHRANSEKPISQASRGAEFPSPEVWVRSLSLGCTSKSGPNSLRGRRRNSEVPPTHSSHHPPLPTATEHQRHPVSPDPRRQATVFPEAPGFPISYQEAPPLLKLNSTVPQYPSNPPNSALPPSWSHPGHAPLTQREPIDERGVEQESPVVAQCVEEAMDGSREEEGRGSYASQSSGRGSLGPLSHQSPSTTPTLTSSPATVQESKTGGRSRVSVDENYEWDATDVYLESDPPKASCTRLNQVCKDMEGRRGCKRPKDLDHKDDPLSHSSCVVKYQLSSGSTCSRDPDHDTVLF
ncbi:hypothetical protein SKAU_G00285070 [Synaphobranchus kaupii]|uniref:Uncharacterized protein n=1 Tax=Synaphobranchus kaupii TaxID=118154 RepID=A0A9Q1EXV7_SYNKA|nr:hypothetical protein SKAU_G00285070 [Synaphobranchus kaupii]